MELKDVPLDTAWPGGSTLGAKSLTTPYGAGVLGSTDLSTLWPPSEGALTYEDATAFVESDYLSGWTPFSYVRTVTVTSKAELQNACTNAVAGDLIVCTGGFTVNGTSGAAGLDVRSQPSGPVKVDLGTGANAVKIVGGNPGTYPAVYLVGCKNFYFYGGDISSGTYGINGFDLEHVRWWDVVVHDTRNSGIILSGVARESSVDFRAYIHNTGLDWPNLDPHLEKGTGVHGCYLGGGTAATYRVTGRIMLDTDHIQPGAAVQVNHVNDLDLYLRANYQGYRADGVIFDSESQWGSGNGVQVWGDDPVGYSLEFTVKYVEAHHMRGRPFQAGGLSAGQQASGLTDSTLEYGRADTCNLAPLNVGTPYWDAINGAIVIVDVDPPVSGGGGGGGSAAVTIRSKASTKNSSGGTATTAVQMPATVNAEDLLLVFIVMADQTSSGWTLPTGWTRVWSDHISATGGGQILGCYKKIADGSEDGTTVNFVASGGTGSAWHTVAHAFALTSTDGTPVCTPVACVDDADASNGLVAPSVTPTADDALVLSVCAIDQTSGAVEPAFGTVTASSGNTVTKEYDLGETGTNLILCTCSEAQTTAEATVHTYPWNTGGTAGRGGSLGALALTSP
jgi:hypothetical protein